MDWKEMTVSALAILAVVFICLMLGMCEHKRREMVLKCIESNKELSACERIR